MGCATWNVRWAGWPASRRALVPKERPIRSRRARKILGELLGPERFTIEEMRRQLPPGVAAGMAWTEAGGEVLYIEAVLLPEGRGLMLTGQLGEVMQESAKTAQSYIWSKAAELGIDPEVIRTSGVHIHVPAGAIRKDGPSAGCDDGHGTGFGLQRHRPAQRHGMTGEISLTGLVLPVGGIKEKVLAANRAGIRRIILPRENGKDLDDLPDNVRKQLEVILADRIEDVLTAAVPDWMERAGAGSSAN